MKSQETIRETGFIFLGYFSKNVADVSRFFYAMDSFGNQCGSNNTAIVYNYGQERIGRLPFLAVMCKTSGILFVGYEPAFKISMDMCQRMSY
uniref:Uncharacterized protein n=1 Tax=Ditylenchus dipsaci TaxID=166011 RepID=A0A915EQI2_9BILA